MYKNMKPWSGRRRGARVVLSFFILSLLVFSFPGLAPDAAAADLNISIEKTSAREGDRGDRLYLTVTVTASKAPGSTGTRDRIFRFVYSVRGTADFHDFHFNGSRVGNNIIGSATTFKSKLVIKGDVEKEKDETITISIKPNDVHNTGLERYPRSLRIGSQSSVTFTIKDDDQWHRE